MTADDREAIRMFFERFSKGPLYDLGWADQTHALARPADSDEDLARRLSYLAGCADTIRTLSEYMSPAYQTAHNMGNVARTMLLWLDTDVGTASHVLGKTMRVWLLEFADLATQRRLAA